MPNAVRPTPSGTTNASIPGHWATLGGTGARPSLFFARKEGWRFAPSAAPSPGGFEGKGKDADGKSERCTG
jgi:hypothetical protein